jgi:hypothetical protein
VAVDPYMIGLALGRLDSTDAEVAQWSMWIDDAVMLIDARKEALEITDPLDEARVDYVVREAVVAHVRRPDNATQVTISVDDASTSKTYRSGKGRVEIIDEWWTLLGLTAPTGGAFSVDVFNLTGNHAAICALAFGALYCSCGADLTNYEYPLYELDDDPVWGW